MSTYGYMQVANSSNFAVLRTDDGERWHPVSFSDEACVRHIVTVLNDYERTQRQLAERLQGVHVCEPSCPDHPDRT